MKKIGFKIKKNKKNESIYRGIKAAQKYLIEKNTYLDELGKTKNVSEYYLDQKNKFLNQQKEWEKDSRFISKRINF